MTQKTRAIIGWVLTGLVGLVMVGSAFMKFKGGEEAAAAAKDMGLTATSITIIALVELLSILLFIIPRTGMLGTLLLAAYLGGAIATHVQHGQPFIAPAVVQALVWVTAAIRFPELSRRIAGNPTP